MLESLTPEQREIIVSLPYRVGLLVSFSDQSGGHAAQQQELDTLANIMEGFTQQVFGSELLQHVMAGTMDRRAEWTRWGETLDSVYEDCRKAVDILHGLTDDKEVGAYRTRLMEIGESVAIAFREFEDMSFMNNVSAYVNYRLVKWKAKKLQQSSYKSFDEFLNISMSERHVLQKLARALGTIYI